MKKTLKSATVFLLTAIFLLLPFLPYAEAAMTYDEMLDYVLESNLKLCNYKDGEIDYDYLAQPYEGDEYAALNEKAREITASCETNYEKAYEINKWVADNVYYDLDYYYHGKPLQSRAAADVFEKRVTVCAGYASLMTAMCRAAGIPSRRIMGTALSGYSYASQIELVEKREINHEWVEVYINGKWNMCDPTWDSYNRYENGEKRYRGCTDRYFNQSNEDFSEGHFSVYYCSPIKWGDYLIRLHAAQISISEYVGTAEKVVLPENENYSSFVFSGNETVKEVTLPDSMTEIPQSFFTGCKNLEKVNFGKNVKKIGMYAFNNCSSIAELNIPVSVEEIVYGAFYGATSLKKIYYDGTKAQWDNIEIGKNTVLDNAIIITSDHEHTFSEMIIKNATCKEAGSKKLVCSSCGFSKTETIAKLAHTFTSSVTKESTCTEKGTKKKACSVCGYSETVELPMKAHNFVLVETKEATCKEEGKAVYTCSLCGAEKTDVIAKTAHRDINGDLLCDFCGESITKNCSCMCHKDGFYGFIYKIVRFFWKLFGTNKECSCGVKHY